MHLDLGAPGPAHGFGEPGIAGTALLGDAEALHDLQLIGRGNARRRRLRFRLYLQVEDLFLLATEQREDAVRWQFVQRLAEVEIVLELLAFGLLAGTNRRPHPSLRPHLLA